MVYYTLFGELIAKDGKRDELAALLQDAEVLLVKDPACRQYSVNLSPEHPDSVFVYERWKDKKSHERSLENAEVRELVMKGRPLIEQMKRHFTLTTISKRTEGV